jgi:pimeloyl-ACP methyl ester carboxylesterase
VRELGLAADRILFPLSLQSPTLAAMALSVTKYAGRKLFHVSMLRALSSPSDRALVASWPMRDATDFFFEALRAGAIGTVADFAILAGDWGFRLEDVPKAVHVVQGVEDELLPRSHALELARLLPHSQLHWVASAGHYAFHGRPEVVFALLK